MKVPELKAALDEMGIEYPKDAKKPALEEAYALAMAAEVEEAPETLEEAVDMGMAEEPEVQESPEEPESDLPDGLKEDEVEMVEFGAMMKLNVRHDGVDYAKGTAVDLRNKETYNLFAQKGWIE